MNAESFIARRLRLKGRIAITCITISYLVMIIAVAVSSGFRSEIKDGLSDLSGDIQILPYNLNLVNEESPVSRNASYFPHLDSLEGISSIDPVIYRAGMVKSGEHIHGVLLKGVEGLSASFDSTALAVCIPSRLMRMMDLQIGDKMLTYFVSDNVKARTFKVAGTYDALVETDERLVVYADLADMQRLNGWEKDQASAFEITVEDKDESSIEYLESEIGYITYSYSSADDQSVVVRSTLSQYPQLFDWLDLIDFNVLTVLLLMTAVAGFNMISGLLIMLFENISTIGLLKSLGMRDSSIAKTFLRSSSTLVLKGMAIGNALALAFCFIQDKTHFLKLSPENYYVDHVPVALNMPSVLVADIISYLVIMVLLTIPAMFISKVDPAQTMRVK